MSEVPASKREWRGPESGILLDSDDNQFDLTELLKGLEFLRDGEVHIRTYDKTNNAVLQDLLGEIKALHTTIKQIHNIEV